MRRRMPTPDRNKTSRTGVLAMAATAGALALTAAACGSSGTSAAPPAASPAKSAHPSASMTESAAAARTVGTDCGMIPAAGMGSMHGMMTDPVVTAASHNPLMTMLNSTAELAKILKYHVVDGHITPADLAAGMTLTTLEGSTLKASKMGAVYEVNNAAVTCGN